MKKLNNLSEKFVQLDEIMHYRVDFDFSKKKSEMGWNDCAISFVQSGTSWNYYKICLEKGKVITINKSSRCQIRKVENGIFKGSYCVVDLKDGGGSYTILYVFDRTNILKYPELKKYLSEKELDSLLDQKEIEKIAANLLNQFDISKTYQEYEMFCDNLPDACWKKKDFAKNVLEMFDSMGSTNLETRVDKKFVKLDLCKEIARKYFVDLAKKRTQEKTL